MIQNWLLSLVLLSASVLGLCICVRTSRLKHRGKEKLCIVKVATASGSGEPAPTAEASRQLIVAHSSCCTHSSAL